MNKSLPQILTAEQARQLIQRYFDAETSEQEEAALKQFIASPEGADAQFNEVRAVMGVAICDGIPKNQLARPDNSTYNTQKTLHPNESARMATCCYYLHAAAAGRRYRTHRIYSPTK